jgi:hypothetical protein
LLGCSKNERRFSSLIHLFIGSDYLWCLEAICLHGLKIEALTMRLEVVWQGSVDLVKR